VLFVFACASPNKQIQTSQDIVQGQHKPEASAGAQEQEKQQMSFLDSLQIESTATVCTLRLKTPAEPNYTIFKLSKPERIVIDLLDTAPDREPEGKEVNNEYIAHIKAIPLRDKDKNFLRVEIFTKKPVAYSTVTQGNSIVVSLTNTAAAAEGNGASAARKTIVSARKSGLYASAESQDPAGKLMRIRDIQYATNNGFPTISIITNRDISNYKAYVLENPLRLVVDLPMTNAGEIKPVVQVNSECIGTIRTGQNNTDARVVVDFKGQQAPQYQVAKETNKVTITINNNTGKTSPIKAPVTPPETVVPAASSQEEGIKQAGETPQGEQRESKNYTGEKISFDFKDADIKNVLRLIADISGMNMIVGERVTGKITLKLENIAWDEALDIILENNGLGKMESKNIVRIDTAEQIKKINEEKLLAKKSQEQVQDTIVKTVDISYAKAKDIASFIKNMNILTPNRGSVTPFELTNKLTINDIPSVVEQIEGIIKEQDIPTRQVMIEARVVQTSPNYVKEMGIRWGGEYQGHQSGGRTQGGADIPISGTLGPDGNSVVDLLTAGNIGIGFGYIKDRYNLDVKLSALENEDKLKILSNPKILTLDNKESEIKQGVALPYLKLNENGVSSTEFKEAVLEMKVKPKITSANTIALNINVKKDQKSAQTGVNNEPGIDVREIKTDLLVASGKTIVIGGIYENTVSTNIKKVPYLADIPFLGRAFRSEKHEDQLTELLVFITVTIVPSPETVAELADKKE